MGNVLITAISKNVLSIFNSVWSDIKTFGYIPDTIHILTAEKRADLHPMLEEMLIVLLDEYKVKNPRIIFHYFQENDYKEIAGIMQSILEKEDERGNVIALEATPGKKADILPGIMLSMQNESCKHIFYSDLKTFDNIKKAPYYLIPSNLIQTFDLKQVVDLV
jgi:hypothetical protein